MFSKAAWGGARQQAGDDLGGYCESALHFQLDSSLTCTAWKRQNPARALCERGGGCVERELPEASSAHSAVCLCLAVIRLLACDPAPLHGLFTFADVESYLPVLTCTPEQAGLLEKALEIMAWVHRCGIEFDTTTYEELIGTVEIASLWDTKAIKAATTNCLAVFPSQLRPGPFDGMRLMYLAHMNVSVKRGKRSY